MIANFIITFREVLEAVLVISIVLGYLNKTGQNQYKKVVWWGVITGIAASILGAFLFNFIAGGFTGAAEEIFEGITMLIGAVLLTTMILWMFNKSHAKDLQEKMALEISEDHRFGIFSLVFISILREGIETVIFLGAAGFAAVDFGWLGSILGTTTAVILGLLLYKGSLKINLKKFFSITSVLLILFAAGLVAHGIHELQEAGVIPFILYPVYDINVFLNDKGDLGSIHKGLFGYNGNPGLIEIISYWVYMALISIVWIKKNKKKIAVEDDTAQKTLVRIKKSNG